MKTLNTRNQGKKKWFAQIGICLTTIYLMSATAFADVTTFGQNAGNWIIEQAFWIGLAFIAVGLIVFILKKAWIPAGIFLFVSSILIYFVSSPEKLKDLGASLSGIFI